MYVVKMYVVFLTYLLHKYRFIHFSKYRQLELTEPKPLQCFYSTFSYNSARNYSWRKILRKLIIKICGAFHQIWHSAFRRCIIIFLQERKKWCYYNCKTLLIVDTPWIQRCYNMKKKCIFEFVKYFKWHNVNNDFSSLIVCCQ